MSDEMIQQQKSGVGAHALTGGVLGAGAGTYLALGKPTYYGYQTKPKYTSFEDIIKDADDSFTKNMEGVEEAVVNDAKEMRNAAKAAGEKYDRDLNEFLEANKEGLKELPAESDAAKELQTAQEAYNAKYNAEVEKLKGTPAVETVADEGKVKLTPEQIQAEMKRANAARKQGIKSKLESFGTRKFDLVDKLTAAEAKGDKEVINQLRSEINALDAEIDEYLDKEVKSWFVGRNGKLKGDSKEAFNSLSKQFRNKIDMIVDAKVCEGVKNSFGSMYNARLTELKSMISDNMFSHIAKDGEYLNEQSIENLRRIFENRQNILANLERNNNAYGNSYAELLGKGNLSTEELAREIETQKSRVDSILTKINEISEIKADVERIAGNGAYIKDGIVYNAQNVQVADEKLLEAANKIMRKQKRMSLGNIPEVKSSEVIDTLKANANQEVKTVVKSVGAHSEKEIADRAKLACEKELNALNIAKENAAKEVEKLGTNKLSVEDLTKAFVEKNGSKEDAIKNATKEFESKTKSLFEKGKLNTWKTAGWIAGGAAAMAVLFALMAPKKKDA